MPYTPPLIQTSAQLAAQLSDETGTGLAVFGTSPTIAGHPTVEGVTSTGATGTGKFVFDGSPALVTPALGTPASGVLTSCTGTADGLTAGDVTRNHVVYAGASPPTVDVGVFTIVITGVNLKAAGTTAVFTVPTSRRFVCISAIAIVTSVTTAGVGTQTFKITESGAGIALTTNTASGSGTPAAGFVYTETSLSPSGGPYSSCAAGNIVNTVVSTSHAGSTAVTGSVFVTGFYSA